jgi:hypothetical protein
METEKLALAIQDALICCEMPLFAFMHLSVPFPSLPPRLTRAYRYAFSRRLTSPFV